MCNSMYVFIHMCHNTYVEVRGQLLGLCSPFSLCKFWALNIQIIFKYNSHKIKSNIVTYICGHLKYISMWQNWYNFVNIYFP